jgi:hypothetical protein
VRHVLRHRARWSLTLYPDAGEAAGSFEGSVRRRRGEIAKPDPERSQREADRRAAAKLRRYCAANRLDRFGTLTYARPCVDGAQLRRDVARFFKDLRRELGGKPLPYAWASEWHPGGHGLHVHFAVGRYVHHSLVRTTWRLGIVDIRRVIAQRRSEGAHEAARVAARYLAKYVSKAAETNRTAGSHRYEVAQGFQPRSLRLIDRSREAVIERASAEMGRPPAYVWRSADEAEWDGPPACWCTW